MVVKSSIFFFKVKGLNNGFSCNAGSYFKEMMIVDVVSLFFGWKGHREFFVANQCKFELRQERGPFSWFNRIMAHV